MKDVDRPDFVEVCTVPEHRLSHSVRATGLPVVVGRTADGRYYEAHGNDCRQLDETIGALYMSMLRPSLLARYGVTETKL